jgi:Ca2+-binding RTX toxin-like protein
MLGPTFQFVFETQLENLQNGDRFYYLDRTAGMHFGIELEMNSFAKLIMANTDVTHLPAQVFATPAWTLEVDQSKQFTGLTDATHTGNADPTFADDQPGGGQSTVLAGLNNPTIINGVEIAPLVIRDNPETAGPDTNYLHYTGNSPVVLGGTEGNDILIAGASDQDTVYGDGGNDTLNGGAGDDNVFGGTGDDIIYSGGGTDTLDGGAGNDVIIESHSNLPVDIPNLLLGGAGQDFFVTSDDINQIFGGPGDDFILAGISELIGQGARNNLPEEGDEGNDWIEEGTQDGAPGDTGAFAQPDPLTFDAVPGNDIFVGGEGFDEMIGEGGDDIFVGSGAQDKMDGMSGFDWTTYKNDLFGVTVDMRLPLFAPAHGLPFAPGAVQPVGQSPDSILDRFAEVEGLSGSQGNDILFGDDQTADIIANITARGSVLTNISLINGLQETLDHFFGFDTASNNHVTSFGAGNIILGGDGSDLIWGNDGDDLIDGDKWLNVRISVRATVDANHDGIADVDATGALVHGAEIASFDSMKDLVPFMRDGIYNPGQLVAVREILPGHGGFDTAVYNNPLNDPVTGLPNYIINIDDGGTPDDFSDDIVTVRDVSAKPLDGTDRLTHIERLQFADQSVVLVPGLNNEPTGHLAILDGVSNAPDDTPTEGQLLRVTLGDVVDLDSPDGIHNPTFVWQQEVGAGTGVFTDIILKPGRIGVGFPTADGSTFTVDPALGLGGLALRVRAVYEDDHGVTEQVFSTPTQPVVAVPVPPATLPTFIDHTQDQQGVGVQFIRSDLDFILDQIKIAERNAAGEDLVDILPNIRVPFGLRTVDGSDNNLINFGNPQPGLATSDQTHFGAADQVFPRLTDPVFRDAQAGTSYLQTNGTVIDSQPRTISNLIVDQTPNNPAAYANAYDPGPNGHLDFGVTGPANDDVLKDGVQLVTSPGLDGKFGTADDTPVFFFPNVKPDAGVSSPFDAWFTFFGQFFDHGLDLVTKGNNGLIFIPLNADDPLVAGTDKIFGTADDLPPQLRFMVETRATMLPGPDGIIGTPDDVHENSNTTTPFVDQNQTYTSHPSHQVFLREYAMDAHGAPQATGRLITNHNLGADGKFGTADDTDLGGMATWAVVKAQARDILGINLTDADVGNVPLLATDPYGNFIRGAHGFPQVVIRTGNGADGIAGTADDTTILVEGNPAAPVDLSNAERTGHQFLIDINASANPFDPIDGHMLLPDADNVVNAPDAPPPPGFYDNELLDKHYIAGDGRVNENIGLTAVHDIFHSEHNRLVEETKQTVLIAEGDTPGYINDWVMPGFVYTPGMTADQIDWNGERLFQVAKFGTEMQYQHLVFEEFARTVQPLVDPFFAPTQVYDTKINPAIEAEFAHTVYRFGHSMLTETVDRYDPNFNVVGDPNSANPDQQLGLIAAFLNPLAYAGSGPTPEEATGAIVRGVTRTVGNQIDEFVTEALRNNLLGTPLDLAVLNIARGRDTGIPSLNEARREFYADISDPDLKPYISWADFMQNIKHPESLVNFIAAYGTHHLITDETTLEGQRAAAFAIVTGSAVTLADGRVIDAPTDRLDFLNSSGTWANTVGADGHAGTADDVTITGLDNVDFWIGGLAEEVTPFGGLLGSTFNFVFENQLEKLQDGDRFYYLERTAGMNFNAELEANTFAKLVEANTDATHLPALIFKAAEFNLEVDPIKQFNADLMLPGPDGVLGTADDISSPRADPVSTGPFSSLIPLVDRDNPATPGPDTNYLKFNGTDATQDIVLGGSPNNDILIAGPADDSVYGDEGNDRIEGGAGNDHLLGGAGDDIISDSGGDDVIEGMDGNDVIQGGGGANILLGGFGQDFVIAGEDASEVFGGPGNDFLFGTKGDEFSFGNEGDDWIERGTSDGAAGDNFDPFGNEPVKGNDVFKGDGGPDNVDGEGGDDIYIATPSESDRFIGFGGFDWATFKDDTVGVTVGLDSSLRFFDQPQMPGSTSSIISRMDLVEGLSGSHHDDFLYGDDADFTTISTAGVPPTGSLLLNPGLIDGLQTFLDDLLHFELAPVGGGSPVLPTGDLFTVVGGVTHISQFGTGNIILGGEGSDIIMGQGGDDLIDGDAWLNVRISVRSLTNHDVEITSVDSMVELIPAMMAGVYNPSQLQIVRELKYAAPGNTDFDTAQFASQLSNYSFTVNGVAVAGTQAALSAATAAAGPDAIITVADNSATGGVKVEGTDHLRHIERLQFSDQAIVLNDLNQQPHGKLTISDTTPTEDQLLTVSIAGVTDPDNVSASNPTGAITGTVSYFWQGELTPGNFQDIMFFGAGETQRAVGTSFTPTEPFVGGINFTTLTGVALRVRAVYTDANGVLEQVFSDATTPVANVNDPPVGTVALSDVTPTATRPITATPVITDADGLTTAVFDFQWQQSATGAAGTWTDIAGAIGPVFSPTNAQAGLHLRAEVTYVDDHGTTEHVFSEATQAVGGALTGTGGSDTITGTPGFDVINGLGGSDTLSGLAGNDTIDGGAGNDTINGGAGDDVLIGGAGNDNITGDIGNDTITGGIGTDIINAGAGDDVINYTMGDGVDTIIGDIGIDTLKITGTTGADILDVIYNGSALTGIEGGTLSGVETVTADLLGGSDTLSYGTATTAAVNVDLTAHSASGFASIAGIENVTGGSGADQLTGDASDNALTGGAGNDTLAGALGNDTLVGGTGTDTVSYLGEADAMFVNLATGSAERGAAANPVEDVLVTIENVVGGMGSDNITGNTGANLLDGGAGSGNDSLFGGAGNDTLLGGDGNDQLVGGAGNDSISGGAGDDAIVYNFGDGTDVLVDGGSGNDNLSILGTAANNGLSVTWNGTAITALTGIQAVSGIDSLTADLQGGTDSLSYAGATAGVTVDLSGHSASGFASIAGIENVTGGSGADTLIGDAGANVLAGGAGNDTYWVGAGDTVTEGAGGGTDTVNSSASFTLGTNVENLNLTTLATINGTGNSAANVMVDLGGGNNVLSGLNGTDTLDGGAGNDTLDGGSGNDVLIGGAGNDRMTGGGNSDIFAFAAGFGNDVITDFDANGNGTLTNQDLLDLSTYDPLGTDTILTSANFGAHVSITASGGNTTVTIDGNTILLQGVSGAGNNVITVTDFLLHL